MVEVIEQFSGPETQVNVTGAIERLLDSVPNKYLTGLGTVVLTDASGLRRRRKRQRFRHFGRKVAVTDCLGFYHHQANGQKPWIELFVDRIVANWSPTPFRFTFTRELMLGRILYHELGHHIHATFAPEHSNPEGVADRWRDRLLKRHFFHAHRYIIWPMVAVSWPWFRAERVWPGLRRARKRLFA